MRWPQVFRDVNVTIEDIHWRRTHHSHPIKPCSHSTPLRVAGRPTNALD